MIGFVIGYKEQRFEITVFITVAVTALMMLMFGPGWPYFGKKTLVWLDADNPKVENEYE